MTKSAALGLFAVAVAMGLLFRLSNLGVRPMHHDEANQAVKFGALLEKGEYIYDKKDHHGPTLYYATLPAAYGRGQATLAELDETTLRLVPAAFGLGLLFLLLYFGPSLHPGAGALAALLAAFSPAMTYYSRFYIHESLFAFFALALLVSVWRYSERLTSRGAFATGLSAGLLFATKETSVIILAAVAVSLVLAFVLQKKTVWTPGVRLKTNGEHIVIAVVTFLAVALVLFSSLGNNLKGPLDAVLAFKTYFAKAGAAGVHAHPWSYYLGVLAFSKSGGLVWSEGLVFVLAFVGIGTAIARRSEWEARQRLALYLVFYTITTTLAFFLLPYKTPWNVLSFYTGWILLAGIGGAFLVRVLKKNLYKAVPVVLILAGLVHLGVQNYRANERYPADPRNPYVYAQTSPDFLKLVRRIDSLAAVHPAKKDLLVKVVAGPSEQWPLPWYLRAYKQVGYWTSAAEAGNVTDAALVIASGENAALLEPALGNRYQVEHFGLREGILLTLFIPNTLWNRFILSR
jgi:uncharacterized protein (TIGR03663 family)